MMQLAPEYWELDPYLRPIIHMSPFSGKLAVLNAQEPRIQVDPVSVLSQQLFACDIQGLLTVNGREALSLALADCVKSSDTVVSIITPSNSGYVSACVTQTLAKYCKHHFGYRPDADIYLLIHEFGRLAELPGHHIHTNQVVIEDCAYACVAHEISECYGRVGDYMVYSLPKAFSIQYGGVLFTRRGHLVSNVSTLSASGQSQLIQQLSLPLSRLAEANHQRLAVYRQMRDMAESFGLEELFAASEAEVPHAFIVKMNQLERQNEIKQYMNAQGIESSAFYGTDGYFLPCHQHLNLIEIEYMLMHFSYIAQSNERERIYV